MFLSLSPLCVLSLKSNELSIKIKIYFILVSLNLSESLCLASASPPRNCEKYCRAEHSGGWGGAMERPWGLPYKESP